MNGADIEIEGEQLKWQDQRVVRRQIVLTSLHEGLLSTREIVWPFITDISHQILSAISHKKMPCEIVGSDTKHQQGRFGCVQERRGRHGRHGLV